MPRSLFGAAMVAAALSLCSAPSEALVIGGQVTGGTSGGVFQLIPPPPGVGPDSVDSPNLVAFNERQDVTLDTPLPLDFGGTIPLGTVVSSHYVVFDPADPSTVFGFVDFDEPILAILPAGPATNATTPLFGVPTTTYTGGPGIGPDMGGGGALADQFSVPPGAPNRLFVNFGANSPGDQLRVLTGVPVPEPATLWLVALGTAATAVVRRS